MGTWTRFQVAPTVTAGGYSQFDVVGGLLTFTGLRGGILRAITVTDKAAQSTVEYLLVLFDSAPTSIADNATYAIVDADLPKIVFQRELNVTNGWFDHKGGGQRFAGAQAFSNNSYHYEYGIDIPIWSAGGTMYGFLIIMSGTTPTYAATTDVTVNLFVEMGV